MSRATAMLALVLGAAAAWAASQASRAEEAPAAVPQPAGSPALRYRLVYAPADRLEECRDKVPYVPMAPEEFQRLVSAANASAGGVRAAKGAAVASARYTARLADDALVDGKAQLDVAHWADGPVLLAWDPCALPVGDAVWAGEKPQAARLGLGPGGAALVVERPGQIQFAWSLRGRRDPTGSLSFALELPPCPDNQLRLDLPQGAVPTADAGLVFPDAPGGQGTPRWRLELGGHNRVTVHVALGGGGRVGPSATALRESLVYDLSLRGLELSAQWQLDVAGEPLRQLALTLDAGLELVSARYGDADLTWSAARGGPGGPTRVVLEFPEPLRGPARLLRLGALAPLELARPYRLPRIRAEGLFWQEGGATLVVAAPLVVEQLTPIEGWQLKRGALPEPRRGEVMELQFFAPEAGIEVLLGRPAPPLQVDSGTAITLDAGEVMARVAADFRQAAEERFQLEAELGRQWTVDSVESTPADAMGDWAVETSEGGPSRLVVRLAKALAPSRPLRLVISARQLRSPLGRSLSLDRLVPLRFAEFSGGRRLLGIRAVEPYRLTLSGDGAARLVDAQQLDPAALALFPGPVPELMLEGGPGDAEVKVAMEPIRPRYSALVRIEATVSQAALDEECSIRVVPEAAPVQRVTVCFSPASEAPPRWTLESKPDDRITAERVRPGEAGAGGRVPAGETWEIRLRPPQSAPFTIHAARTVAHSGKGAVGLIAVPEATVQEGAVIVDTAEGVAVRIAHANVQQAAVEAPPPDQYSTARAVFRYRPESAYLPGSQAAISFSAAPASPLFCAAWAWTARLQSRYQTDGAAEHLATYCLENTGRSRMVLDLPPTVRPGQVRGAWVDRQPANWQAIDDDRRPRVAIELPAGKRFPTVSLRYTTSGQPLTTGGTLAPQAPQPDLPVLQQAWTAWLPPGVEAYGADSGGGTAHALPASWPERLFGPLWRRGARVVDLFLPGRWLPAAGWSSADDRGELAAAALVERLGRELALREERLPAAMDWGSLLAADSVAQAMTDPAGDQQPVALLVDAAALDEWGITPRTPVRPVPSDDAVARGRALLAQAGLTLLVQRDAIVLTSLDAAALDRDQLTPLESPPGWAINPGPLADRVHQAAGGARVDTLLPAAAWNRRPVARPSPWGRPLETGLDPADMQGWTAYRLETSATQPASLSILFPDTLESLRWIVFVAAVGLGCWKLARQPAALTAIAGAAAAVALVASPIFAPLASGVFLGSLFTLGLAAVARRRGAAAAAAPSEAGPDRPKGNDTTAPPAAAVGALVVLLGLAWLAPAEEPPTPPGPAEAPYRVFIPVDAQGKPAGNQYYVPEGLYQELHRRAAVLNEEPQGWLLCGATYRGTLAQQTTPQRLELTQLKATFELEVFNPRAGIRIPVGGEGVKLLPGGALLDGRAIEPRWEPDGKTLLVDIAEPGQHRLELLIEPTTQAGDAFTGFSLATARLPLARLELSVPADAGKIEVPSALGSVTTEADPPRVVADLGPSDRLTVRWQGAAGRAPGAPPADVEQLLWLKVQPGAVVLDACLKLKAAEGRVRQLRLVTDPRLRLLPLQGPDPPTADVQSLPGQPQSIRLEFPQPIADQTVLRLSFLVTGSTGVGNLGLPRIELPDARTTLRWVAVWLDPSLRGEPHPGAAETLAPPTFAAAWGPSDLQPAMAFSLPSAETAWSIATQPQPADTTAEQVQTCLAAPGSVQVDFRARLITAVGYQFQYRVLAPKQFEVDEVSLQEQSADCLARWSRDPSGAVVLMLTRRLSGPQQLSIRGRFPVANRATIALPLLGVEGATVSSHTIGVFREPGVRVQYTPAGGLTEFEPGKAEEDLAPGGQLVAWLRADPSQPIRAELLVSANRPQVTVRQLTSVRRVGNRWQAGVDCRAHVESGVVEEFRFRTDPSWKGPYQVTPADSLQVMEKPGGGHELLLRPRAPVEGDYRFTVWGPLTADSSGRVQVPAIELQQATVLEHWLALPAQEAGRALRWDTENLRQGPLPGAWVNPGEKPQTIAAYQVVGDQPFQAVLEPAQGPPQVRLADIRMEWRPDDTFRGVATLEVYAAGEPHAVLQLPPGAQLVSVHLGGIAIKPTLERGNLWDVPMLPVSCPQFLDVVFAGTLPDSSSLGGGYALEAPSLVGLPVRESLWVVDCHSEDVYAATDGVQPVDPFQCAMIRLRGLAGAIKTVVDSPVHDAEGKLPCYRNLVRRWAAARNEVQQALSGNPRAATQAVQSAAAEFEALDREQSQLAERLGASDLLTQATAVGTPAGEPAEAWSRSLPPSGATACFVDSRGRSRIVLRTGRVEASPGLLDWLAGAAVIGLTCLAVWVLRRGAVPKAWRPSPQAVGIVAGLAWWLWFWPGVLGLAVALSCLIVWLYPALRRRRQDGSGVVPIRARPPR